MLEAAVWTAGTARHDEVAATAAIVLIYVIGYQEGRFDVGEIWCRHSEALLRRMGKGHDRLWGSYFANRAAMREQQGRLEEAIADARLSIEAKERAYEASSPDLG